MLFTLYFTPIIWAHKLDAVHDACQQEHPNISLKKTHLHSRNVFGGGSNNNWLDTYIEFRGFMDDLMLTLAGFPDIVYEIRGHNVVCSSLP